MLRKVCQSFNRVTVNRLNIRPSSCWSCHMALNEAESRQAFCPCEKRIVLPPSNLNNYFNLFSLEVKYKLEKIMLTKRFRELMRQLHPDLFTLKSQTEKEYSSLHASLLNKAYSTLKSPIERGEYMLKLEGIDTESIEGDVTSDKQQMLMEIMEMNEFIDEIIDEEQVQELEARLESVIRPLEKQLENNFACKDLKNATGVVGKMKYYENVSERLDELKLKFDLDKF